MWWRKPSPEAEEEKREMAVVKRRLTKVEGSLRRLTIQVKVLKRNAGEGE